MTMQIGDNNIYKGCLGNWSTMLEEVTGATNSLSMYLNGDGDDSISLPQCFWLRVKADDNLLPEEPTTMAGEDEATTMAGEDEATTMAGEEDDTTVADGGDGGNGGESRAWRWKAEKTFVKVDHCVCITGFDAETGDIDANADPCNANGCPSCLACPGGDLSEPDMDQFCQR